MDVDGISILTGLAWSRQTDIGTLLLAAFFEGGWGNYDSHNSFSNAASVGGSGDTEYLGGGLLGRLDFAPLGPGNAYAEASLRLGRVKTDFFSDDMRYVMGNHVSYD